MFLILWFEPLFFIDFSLSLTYSGFVTPMSIYEPPPPWLDWTDFLFFLSDTGMLSGGCCLLLLGVLVLFLLNTEDLARESSAFFISDGAFVVDFLRNSGGACFSSAFCLLGLLVNSSSLLFVTTYELVFGRISLWFLLTSWLWGLLEGM